MVIFEQALHPSFGFQHCDTGMFYNPNNERQQHAPAKKVIQRFHVVS